MNDDLVCPSRLRFTATRIEEIIDVFFDKIAPLNCRDFHGGYLCVALVVHDVHAVPTILRPVGSMPLDFYNHFLMNVYEKVQRLGMNPGDTSGYQSSDIERSLYPGSIRAGGIIVGFAGMDWKLDEALCLATVVRLQFMREDQAEKIAKISDNELYTKVLNLL